MKTICGWPIRFNVWSKADENNIVHRFLPGSLNEWAEHPNNVRALINHGGSCLLGQTNDNSLKLTIFFCGLYFELNPYRNTNGLSILYEDLRQGRCQGASVKFVPIEFSDKDCSGQRVRHIGRTYSKIELLEINLMDFAGQPLFPQTSVKLKY